MNNQNVKFNPISLLGVWSKNGNEYQKPLTAIKLLIVDRKHKTENKPTRYILIKHETEQREYLSGMFPTEESNKYRIDYKGKNYIITFTDSVIFSIEKK